jgi:purine nucleosidase
VAVPIVIDTDTAQDDCVAILAALLDPVADLRAITMVAGNVSFDRQVKNAFMTLNVAGRLGQVPLHLGCRRPLVREWESAENVHGDGTGGLDVDLTGYAAEAEPGVDALVRLVAERPGEVTVVAIGPLTNIAVSAATDPSFARNVKQLWVMGGANNARGNITPAAEYNFYVDPDAAKAVFAAGFNITVVPWAPLTLRDAVFSREQLAEIEALGTPLARFFIRVCGATLKFDESVGIPGTTHPDSLSVALALHPELYRASGRYHVDVEADSDLTRGYAAMSWSANGRNVHGLVPNATVVEEADGLGFFAHLKGLLAVQTTPNRRFGVGPGTAR